MPDENQIEKAEESPEDIREKIFDLIAKYVEVVDTSEKINFAIDIELYANNILYSAKEKTNPKD